MCQIQVDCTGDGKHQGVRITNGRHNNDQVFLHGLEEVRILIMKLRDVESQWEHAERVKRESQIARIAARDGFTLIELLVAVTIIGILLGLLLPAVMGVWARAQDTKNVSEIQQLSAAMQQFRTQYGFYPPSRFYLAESYTDYFTDPPACKSPVPLYADSLSTLTRMFPRIKASNGQSWAVGPTIDWNQNGTIDGVAALEGDQCLVWFLQGFGTNPTNPLLPPRTPLYQFQAARLAMLHGNLYQSYLDAHGARPLAYFSSYNTPNGYNRYQAMVGASDCSLLGVSPYSAGGQFQNIDTFQIVSAGRDRVFFAGGPTWGAVPSSVDDRANFSSSPLGAN